MGLDCRRKNPFGSGFGCLVVTLSFAQFVVFYPGFLPLVVVVVMMIKRVMLVKVVVVVMEAAYSSST